MEAMISEKKERVLGSSGSSNTSGSRGGDRRREREREREREYGGWEMEERRDYIIKNSVNHGNVILVKKCAEYLLRSIYGHGHTCTCIYIACIG